MQNYVIWNLVVRCRNLKCHGLRNSRILCAVTGTAHVGRVSGEDQAKLATRDVDTGSIVCGQSYIC